MGGRPPKLLGDQKGHLTKDDIATKTEAEDAISIGFDKAKKPNKKLLIDDVAVKEYKRVLKLIQELKILALCDMDIANICGYCNSYSQYFKATAQLKEEPFIVEKAQGPAVNPLVEIQKTYASEMRRFGSLIGADVSSRLKLSLNRVQSKDDGTGGIFGDI